MDYFDWLDSLLVDQMFIAEYHATSTKPVYRLKQVPFGNVLISPVRLTQRKIKSVPNRDPVTKDIIPQKWISTQIEIDPYAAENEAEYMENTSDYLYNYTKEGSFMNNGGYVVNLDVQAAENPADIKQQIDSLRNNYFLNNQTKVLATDMMFYNTYTDIYTIVIIVNNFKPTGIVETKGVEYMNIKGNYYDFREFK